MRAASLFVLLCLSGVASAERQLYIPTARKLVTGTVKFESRFDHRFGGSSEQYLGVGLTPYWELELRTQNFDFDRFDGTFDLTYNLIPPLTSLSPGIAFGVQDVANQSEAGTRPFGVVTFREGIDGIGGELPADVTLGLTYFHRRLYPLVGLSFPFSQQFRVMAEHDGRTLSAGLEIQPVRALTLSLIARDETMMFGFGLRHRF